VWRLLSPRHPAIGLCGSPGVGDGGAGGIQTSVGKLAVYTAAAGIDPRRETVLSLYPGALLHFEDFGANNARRISCGWLRGKVL
jgi:hypothetical protein